MWSQVTALGGQIEFMDKILYLLSAPSKAQNMYPGLWTFTHPSPWGRLSSWVQLSLNQKKQGLCSEGQSWVPALLVAAWWCKSLLRSLISLNSSMKSKTMSATQGCCELQIKSLMYKWNCRCWHTLPARKHLYVGDGWHCVLLRFYYLALNLQWVHQGIIAVDKQNVIYPCNRVLFSHKKKCPDICYSVNEPEKHCIKWKRSFTQRLHIMWFSSYDTSKIGNSIETGSRLVFA